MSSLIICTLKAVPRSQHLGAKCFLHSSPHCQSRGPYILPNSSRRRLAKDLKPAGGNGHLEVARRDHPSRFERHRQPRSGSWRSDENSASGRYESDTKRGRSGEIPRPAEELQSTHSRTRTIQPMLNELYHPPAPATITSPNNRPEALTTTNELPTTFTSPPLMTGFVTCLADILGPHARPTPIQALSIKWLLDQNATALSSGSQWRQFLMAAETGSGKSIAYLLPVLQDLKQSEVRMHNEMAEKRRETPELELNPRALILAPTHELSRQLSGFAKALSHEVKLRVLCASRANIKETRDDNSSWKRMRNQFEEMQNSDGAETTGNGEMRKASIPLDIVVGTPMKLLEMVRGRGWNREEVEDAVEDVRWRRQTGKPEMGLANIEWVVVDEADILFDPDFQEYTRMLLADISAARGTPIPFSAESSLSATALSDIDKSKSAELADRQPMDYPFNLILTTATIPSALASYLDTHHPNLIRLASPDLHHLPKTLKTQYASWTGGNKFADIERRIRQVWADDSMTATSGPPLLSKILIFCNKSTKVEELGKYLTEGGIKNVALTSTSEQRRHGSNKHLKGFLRPSSIKERRQQPEDPSTSVYDGPRVMITTSLLSRGLDFSPDMRHVFIVDQPRNMIDFLHRAGRSGRAGQKGNVVIFGKTKGRGSAQAKEAKKRVHALVA